MVKILKQSLLLNSNKLNFRTVIIWFQVITVLIFTNLNLYSQEALIDSQAVSFIAKGDSLASLKIYDQAADSYKLAMDRYLTLDLDQWYSSFGKFRKARFKGANATNLVNEITSIAKSINEQNHLLKGKIYFYIGYYNTRLGYTNDAVNGFKKAITELNNEKKDTSNANRFLLYTSENIALNYSRLGDQKSAIKYIELGIELSSKMAGKPKMCSLLMNHSKFLFYDKKIKQVKSKLNQALEVCKIDLERGDIYDYMAEALIFQDSLKLAREYLDKSKEIGNKKGYFFYETSAKYFEKTNNIEEASIQYEKALEILENSHLQRVHLKTLMLYAELLYKNGKKEEALANSHLVLRKYYPELDSSDFTDRLKINNELPDVWIIEALYIKAKYFREKYIENNDQFSLGEATFYYDLLLSHFDKLKSKQYASSSKYRIGAHSQKIYSEVISFYVDQYSKSETKENIESAFSLAQRANSYVLRNAVSDREALELAGVNQDSLEYYLYLTSKISTDVEEDQSNDANLLMEFDRYKESLLANYPSYGKYDREQEINIDEVQSSINENSLVLKYYYFNDVLTVFGISKNSVFAENIELPQEIDSLITSNLNILSQDETNDSLIQMYLKNSKSVYDLVLGDLLEKYNLGAIDHLIIVPDGPLKKVAFNALVINDNEDWTNPNSYLISKCAVNYMYYCSQLKSENNSYKLKDGFLGFGIEYEDEFLKEIINNYMSNFKEGSNNSRAISLSPLKYADDEVLSTAEILGGSFYINSDVTPSQVFSTIQDYDVVHFSAHAFVDEDEYLNSFVVLNKDDGENYQLRYSDILNLDIDSELIVLSACQTGSGKSVVGEGLMSLSRAFVQSGGNAAVGAYWNAPDYSTKELMALFYANLKNGLSKSKAMQQAQIEYLTNDNISSPTIRSPFFWASWAIYGDDQPLRMTSSFWDFSSWKIYLLLAIGLIVLFLLFRYFSRK